MLKITLVLKVSASDWHLHELDRFVDDIEGELRRRAITGQGFVSQYKVEEIDPLAPSKPPAPKKPKAKTLKKPKAKTPHKKNR